MEIPDSRIASVGERRGQTVRTIDVAIDGMTIAIEDALERSDDGTYWLSDGNVGIQDGVNIACSIIDLLTKSLPIVSIADNKILIT